MKLSEYISNYRKENHMSLRALAEKSGCSFQYISKLEKGQVDNPSVLKLKQLSNAMGTSLNELFSVIDDISVDMSDSDNIANFSKIPLYSTICCGNGGFVDDEIMDYISLPPDKLNPHKEYFAQIASGESMINAGIHPGDILVFEKTSSIDPGDIGCFCIDDNDAMCKRYTITDDHRIRLIPENPKYDPIYVDPTMDHFRCIGKLVYCIVDMEGR